MYTIQGPLNVSVNSENNYTVIPANGISYTWIVQDGVIISGQGTPTIKVKFTSAGDRRLEVQVEQADHTTIPGYVIVDVEE